MRLEEFLSRLEGVKGSSGNHIAKCPAHDDNHQSLSVAQGNKGGIVLTCHAGCDTPRIMAALGLKMTDLAPDGKSIEIERIYDYHSADGKLLYQKIRRVDKSFTQRRPDGRGGWIWNRKGVSPTLYNLPAVIAADTVYVAEGERDADTLSALGYVGTSGENGAGKGKWKLEYIEVLRGKTVYVLFDNDAPGREHGIRTAESLLGVAKSVKLLDLLKAFPRLPEKGDISDVRKAAGDDLTRKGLEALVADTPEYASVESAKDKEFWTLFKTLDQYDEQEATWLVAGWIPEGQITVMASDGGVGKTSTWCDILAAMSNGASCILDSPGTVRAPMKVAFLSTEDSVRKKLKSKLRIAGANMQNILTPDFAGDKDDLLRGLKFGTPAMAQFIRYFRPAFCVYDPVQGFVPPQLNMGSRNGMRDCLAPLIALGEECGTTFLILCHTNKRPGAYGRDRIADSADLWDISRSIIMAGFTEEQDVRYLSNEKNNYTKLQETVLFTIDGQGQVQRRGTSWKRDKEYIAGANTAVSKPKREDCKESVLQVLEDAGGSMKTAELEDKLKEYGYTFKTIERARTELRKSNEIKYFSTGNSKNKVWYTQKVKTDTFTELNEDTPVPWSEQKSFLPSEI